MTQLSSQACCAILAERGVVAVAGADAGSFLDNLVTNDLEGMDEGEARLAALLTPQGKILFEFFVVKTEAGFLLDVRRDKAADLVKRLTLYRLRAKVEIKDVSADGAVAAIWWEPPGAPPTSFTYEAEVMASFADPRDRRLGLRLIVRHASGLAPVRDLNGVTLVPADRYDAARVATEVGEGERDYPLGDAYPHEANYDLVNGVSFKKGCFVGQEVVARMQNKTVVRKRVVSISGNGLRAGAEIKIGDAVIGSVGTTSGDRALGLVRLDRALEAAAASQVLTVDGQPITIDPAALERYKQSVANKPVIDL